MLPKNVGDVVIIASDEKTRVEKEHGLNLSHFDLNKSIKPGIKPSGDKLCYKNAIEYAQKYKEHKGLKLMYGFAVGIKSLQQNKILVDITKHAWVEFKGEVIDPTWGSTIAKQHLYFGRQEKDLNTTPKHLMTKIIEETK